MFRAIILNLFTVNMEYLQIGYLFRGSTSIRIRSKNKGECNF